MELLTSKTRQCPFCAETIMAQAVKCRYCNEFLNTGRAKALQKPAGADEESTDEKPDDDSVLFAAPPSLWAMAPAVVKGAIFFALAVVLMRYPLENLRWLGLDQTQAALVAKYRFLFGLGLACLVVLILLYKALNLKMTYYEVTPDRIEYSRGILDRRVDNLDMFRVIDLKLRRSLFDCVVGVGTVSLVTTDKSDPEFVFQKVRYSRLLYDAIKKASLEADRKSGVIHLE